MVSPGTSRAACSYDPDSSWNPYLELSANYRFLGDWSVYGVARYTRLSDEITDSPMVDKSGAV